MNATKYHIGKNPNTQRKKTETTASTVGRVLAMDETGKGQFRNPKRPEEISSNNSIGNGFLKTAFLPKLKENDFDYQLLIKLQNDDRNKISKIERDFFKSLSLLSDHYHIKPMMTKDFGYPYNIALSLCSTEKLLKNTIADWDNFRLVQKENTTCFISEERFNTGTSLFYIPVIPIYKMLKDKKRRNSAKLLLSISSYLYRCADIPYYRQEDSYLYYNYEMLNDWVEEDEESVENLISKKELRQAEVVGDIMERKIVNSKNLSFFRHRIENFKPNDNFDKECLEIAKKSFQLYSNFPDESFFRNVHFNNLQKNEDLNDEDNYNEEKVISIDKYVSFFAYDKGLIYQNLIDCINNEFNEFGEVQEPIIIKEFNGNEISNNNLHFENQLFEILRQLAGILSDY